MLQRQRIRHHAGLRRSARIFGIGLSRTGTTSLDAALRDLGFRSVHFPADERSRTEIGDFLQTGGTKLRLSILGGCDALTDTPVSATFEALDAAYPGSKFIETVRDKDSWLDSCQRFWAKTVEPVLRAHDGDSEARYMAALCEALYSTVSFDRHRFAEGYEVHRERVRSYFADRPGDILRINICAGEGWSDLCDFLGQDAPASEFPWTNSTLFGASPQRGST